MDSVKPKIFIVHGRNKSRLKSIVKIIRDNGFEPIILNERPSKSNTIIEKLEKNVIDVKHVFVMYTACDEGRIKKRKGRNNRNLTPRARQNVIFEHGFFIAKLGRENTTILYENGVEKPTDIEGITYVELDRSGRICKKEVEKILNDIKSETQKSESMLNDVAKKFGVAGASG